MVGQETRNKLTDYWAAHDVEKGQQMAILTNVIHQEWSGVSVKTHKQMKGLKSQPLRDHMTEAELIFTALAELSTRQIAETTEAKGMPQNGKAAKAGGHIAKRARLELEEKTGRKVVSKRKLPATHPGHQAPNLPKRSSRVNEGKRRMKRKGQVSIPYNFPQSRN